jgi:hypothetical protein
MSGKSKYKPKGKRYQLTWPEGHDLHGLEVTLRAMRLGELEKMGGLIDQVRDVEGETDNLEQAGSALAVLGTLRERMAKVLVWWNRLDEDTMKWNEETEEYEETEDTKVLSATPEGLAKLEDWEFNAILEKYMNMSVGVSPDLGKDSNSGQLSLVELPMTDQ